jgi:hypothetical protein
MTNPRRRYGSPGVSASMAFADTDDVGTRLGHDLSDAEKEQASFLLDGVTSVIEEAVGKREEAIDPELPVLRFLSVEKVVRVMSNPQGLSSQSEALGAYSHTERFNSGSNPDLMLTDLEVAMARKAVHGRLSGTAEPASLASDLCALCHLAPTLTNGEWLCGCEPS